MFRRFLCALFFNLIPGLAFACSCGCGVFDVQTGSMMPNSQGGLVWIDYDFMNQKRNWSGTSGAPGNNNDDKQLRSNFFIAGAEYMFNRDWGAMIQVPYIDREFATTDSAGDVVGLHNNALGDIHLEGIYSGFSSDMSSGITFGLKLPTGDYSHQNPDQNWDRDSQTGTGSTDLLLGGYHMGALTKDNSFSWFVNGSIDVPLLVTAGYRPGDEFDAVSGIYYNQWKIAGVKIAPIAQVVASYRLSDSGPASDQNDTGYKRVYLSPAVEVDAPSGWHVFGDVAFPVYQQMDGNQLIADEIFKVTVSHDF